MCKVTVFNDSWRSSFDNLNKFSEDFMKARKQPIQQKREDLFPPDLPQ